jgi:hypothetical protein
MIRASLEAGVGWLRGVLILVRLQVFLGSRLSLVLGGGGELLVGVEGVRPR